MFIPPPPRLPPRPPRPPRFAILPSMFARGSVLCGLSAEQLNAGLRGARDATEKKSNQILRSGARRVTENKNENRKEREKEIFFPEHFLRQEKRTLKKHSLPAIHSFMNF
jgi:hypothetical protein